MKDYMLAGEVARALRVSSKTITRWAREGVRLPSGQLYRLPHSTTPGGHRRYATADVQALAVAYGIEHEPTEEAS